MKPIAFKIRGMINGAIIGALIGFLFIANTTSWVLDLSVIVSTSLLFGLMGYLWPNQFITSNKVAKSQSDKVQPQRIQFSLARLLLATAMVALVFGTMKYLFDYKEPAEIIVTSIIAIALGCIILIGTKRDFRQIILLIAILTSMGMITLITSWIAYLTAKK